MEVGQMIATKEIQSGQFRSKFTEELMIPLHYQAELRMVEEIPERGGERLMSILSKFNRFPWTQDTMVATAQLDEVLIMFLHKHLRIEGEVLRNWADSGVLHIRSLKALATYEATHTPMSRPDIRHLVEEYKAQAWAETKRENVTLKPDSLVESARKLSGETIDADAVPPKLPGPLGKRAEKPKPKSKRGRGRATKPKGRKTRKSKLKKAEQDEEKLSSPLKTKLKRSRSVSQEHDSRDRRGNSKSPKRRRRRNSNRRRSKQRSASRRGGSGPKRDRSETRRSRSHRDKSRDDRRGRYRYSERQRAREFRRWGTAHSKERSRSGRERSRNRASTRGRRRSRSRSYNRRGARDFRNSTH